MPPLDRRELLAGTAALAAEGREAFVPLRRGPDGKFQQIPVRITMPHPLRFEEGWDYYVHRSRSRVGLAYALLLLAVFTVGAITGALIAAL